jgi:hypothetical protein
MEYGCPACRAKELGEPFRSDLEKPPPQLLTDDELYERSVSRGGMTSLVIATCLLLIGFILQFNFGQGASYAVLIVCLGLYAHGFIGMAQRRALNDEPGSDSE